MPRKDGTGPAGAGAKKGRQMGKCKGAKPTGGGRGDGCGAGNRNRNRGGRGASGRGR